MDDRWRKDRFYLFYAYDRIIKNRILTVNNMIKSRNKSNTNAGSLVDNNFKNYWKSKYDDLTTMEQRIGLLVYL